MSCAQSLDTSRIECNLRVFCSLIFSDTGMKMFEEFLIVSSRIDSP